MVDDVIAVAKAVADRRVQLFVKCLNGDRCVGVAPLPPPGQETRQLLNGADVLPHRARGGSYGNSKPSIMRLHTL